MVKSPQPSGLVFILFGVGIWLDKQLVQKAVDCLGEALAFCIIDNEDIPMPSSAWPGEIIIAPPALVAAKAALYIATKEAGLSKSALACFLSNF